MAQHFASLHEPDLDRRRPMDLELPTFRSANFRVPATVIQVLATVVGLAVLAVLVVLIQVWLRRNSELFCVVFRAGRVRVVRGRIPLMFLDEVRSAARSNPLASGQIRSFPGAITRRIEVRGCNEATEQRLRNVFVALSDADFGQSARTPGRGIDRVLGSAILGHRYLVRTQRTRSVLRSLDSETPTDSR